MLDIRNVRKVFARGTAMQHTALGGVDLHLSPGEFATVIGSNGAGKSTLFNVICGSVLPDGGRILLGGEDITWQKEHRRAKVIGRVFQDPMRGTAPHMTIEENLSLAHSRTTTGPLHFAPTRAERALFRDRLSEFGMGLEDRMRTKVGLLSGGQRQVVTLLMCTIVSPRLLLLDEHTAALDPATADKVMDITRRIVAEQRLTTLMITHDMRQALSTGTRTIMMDEGAILFDLAGAERAGMTVDRLLGLYSVRKNRALTTDRMLFG